MDPIERRRAMKKAEREALARGGVEEAMVVEAGGGGGGGNGNGGGGGGSNGGERRKRSRSKSRDRGDKNRCWPY
jgi:hypothetical protein